MRRRAARRRMPTFRTGEPVARYLYLWFEAGFTARRIFDSVEKINKQTFMPTLVARSLTG
jgi:hypothetical protein